MHLKKIVIPAILSVLTMPAFTESASSSSTPDFPERPQFSLVAGFTFGGDTLGELQYVDGSSQKLKAGGMFQIGMGLSVPVQDSINLQLNAVYHWDTVAASNGDASFKRVVVEAIPYWRFGEKLSVGAGLSYNLNPKLDGDFTADYKFESAAGLVLSAMMHIDDDNRLDFRLASIDYELKSIGSFGVSSGQVETVDGGYLGIIYQRGLGG